MIDQVAVTDPDRVSITVVTIDGTGNVLDTVARTFATLDEMDAYCGALLDTGFDRQHTMEASVARAIAATR